MLGESRPKFIFESTGAIATLIATSISLKAALTLINSALINQ